MNCRNRLFTRLSFLPTLAAAALLGTMAACAPKPATEANAAGAAELAALRAEVAAAQAQGAIRSLMHSYGRLIDARDWDGFAAIWTDDAVYVGGPGSDANTGGRAIGDFLRGIFASNPSGVGEPNFHVFFNEEIHVTGDTATATSMSTFVTPAAANGAPTMVILARYEDEFVRTNGDWKFKKRVVNSKLPAPRPKKP